jgi:hypothetical protein
MGSLVGSFTNQLLVNLLDIFCIPGIVTGTVEEPKLKISL